MPHRLGVVLGSIEDGTVQGNIIIRIDLPIQQPLKAVMPHNDDPAFDAPELIDHSSGNHDSAVGDSALIHREHAAGRQESVGVDVHPVR